jgi:hypothetical protein
MGDRDKRSSLLPLVGLVNILKSASSPSGSQISVDSPIQGVVRVRRENEQPTEPLVRNFTEAFRATRGKKQEANKKRITLLNTRKVKVVYDAKAAAETTGKGSYFSWGRSSQQDPSASYELEGKNILGCQLCIAKFGILKKKHRCPLCECYICANCLNPSQVEIDPVYAHEKPVSVWVCKVCGDLLKQSEERARVKEAIEAAGNHPLVYYHGILSEVLGLLRTHIPRFQKMVNESSTVEQLQAAAKLELNLVELMRNFDIGIKKLSSIKLENEYDKRVQEHIKRALINFLQDNLAKFRALQNQRKELLAAAMTAEKAGKEKKGSKDKGGLQPFVTELDRAMSPMGGTKVTIHGENFMKTTKVEIGGVECKVRFIDSNTLSVQAPPLKEEGFKDVEVINGESLNHRLPGILLYSAQCQELLACTPIPSPHLNREKQEAGDQEPPFQIQPQLNKNGNGNGNGNNNVNLNLSFNSNTSVGSRPFGHNRSSSFGLDEMISSSTAPQEPPTIKLLHPAIAPLSGTKLRITGQNFCSQSSVLIGGTKTKLLSFTDSEGGSQILEVQSPKLPAGVHPVEVVNPGGKKCVLEDVLFYTDDPSLLADLSSPAPTSPSPSSSSSSSSSLSSSLSSSSSSSRSGGLLTKARSFAWGRNSLPAQSPSPKAKSSSLDFNVNDAAKYSPQSRDLTDETDGPTNGDMLPLPLPLPQPQSQSQPQSQRQSLPLPLPGSVNTNHSPPSSSSSLRNSPTQHNRTKSGSHFNLNSNSNANSHSHHTRTKSDVDLPNGFGSHSSSSTRSSKPTTLTSNEFEMGGGWAGGLDSSQSTPELHDLLATTRRPPSQTYGGGGLHGQAQGGLLHHGFVPPLAKVEPAPVASSRSGSGATTSQWGRFV